MTIYRTKDRVCKAHTPHSYDTFVQQSSRQHTLQITFTVSINLSNCVLLQSFAAFSNSPQQFFQPLYTTKIGHEANLTMKNRSLYKSTSGRRGDICQSTRRTTTQQQFSCNRNHKGHNNSEERIHTKNQVLSQNTVAFPTE